MNQLQISALEQNSDIMKHYYGDDTGKYMFIEDIALITLSTPYEKTTRFLRPVCIPYGPKFKDVGRVQLKNFQNTCWKSF